MNYYKLNREIFEKKLKNNSITILYSGATKQSSGDECYDFMVNTNFFYLTGIDQESVFLVIEKKDNEIKESLFQYKNDPVKVRWIGAYLEKEESIKISKVENVYYDEEWNDFLKNKISNNEFETVYLDLEEVDFKGQVDFGYEFKNQIEKMNSKIIIEDCYTTLVTQRGVKKDYEIAKFQKAVDITKVALEDVMKNITHLTKEYQAQAIFEGSIRYQANCEISFKTIAAAGKNAATLHYSENSDVMNQNEMILLDLGACFNKYHADITRTYPIGGKYSDLQKRIYSIVLGCNKMVIAEAKPGVTIRELQQKTINFLAEGMLKEHLIETKEEIKKYYFHGISHHIGLDTHDPYPRALSTLEEGMIISDEPGLYIPELKIGIRIEDDLLITKDGCKVLSKDIIKEIDDIEKFIAEHK